MEKVHQYYIIEKNTIKTTFKYEKWLNYFRNQKFIQKRMYGNYELRIFFYGYSAIELYGVILCYKTRRGLIMQSGIYGYPDLINATNFFDNINNQLTTYFEENPNDAYKDEMRLIKRP